METTNQGQGQEDKRQRGEEAERQEEGVWGRREGDVSVCRKKAVSEDTGDSV